MNDYKKNLSKRSIYAEKQVQEDLFQYEMGIELGADVEKDKLKHRKAYEKKLKQKLKNSDLR